MYDLNDKAWAIRNIQNRLKVLGYYDGTLNGRFDNLTRSALMNFQRKENLEVTGAVDYTTFVLLDTVYMDFMSTNNSELPVKKQNNSPFVREINSTMRNVLEYYYGAYDLDISTYYSDKTQGAVDELRRIFGMEEYDGIDQYFYERLLKEWSSIRKMSV